MIKRIVQLNQIYFEEGNCTYDERNSFSSESGIKGFW